MGDKCHFAHKKEDLRAQSDPLPLETPYISDPKLTVLNSIGISSLSTEKFIDDIMLEKGFDSYIKLRDGDDLIKEIRSKKRFKTFF